VAVFPADVLEHANGFARHLRADAVAGEDKDGEIHKIPGYQPAG
jgi:hypothetical protein